MKRIAITGALGHIGSELIRRIPSHFPDVEILLIDNLATQRYCSLYNLPESGKYKFLQKDILLDDLSEIFQGADIVIHLAAITDAESSLERSKEFEEVNFTGTQKVASACLSLGVKLLFVSTTSVYGSQETIVDESSTIDDGGLTPQSPYADSKLKSEIFIQSLGAHGLDFVICRFGTIHGVSAGMRFHTAVNKFSWQAAMGSPLTVWKSALNQKRPYLGLDDAVAAMVFILSNKIFDNEIYNVITANLTVNDLMEIIKKRIDDVQIDFVDSPIMNQFSYEVCREKFIKKGFIYSGNVGKDINNTIEMLINSSKRDVSDSKVVIGNPARELK